MPIRKPPANSNVSIIQFCPKCENTRSEVIDSRETANYIRRRRKCPFCNHRWTTYEILESEHRDLKHRAILGAPFNAFQADFERLAKKYLKSLEKSRLRAFIEKIRPRTKQEEREIRRKRKKV